MNPRPPAAGGTGTAVAVFTRDLRVRDNPVLAAAARAGRVVPLFVLDRALEAAPAHRAPARAGFLAQSLADLDRSLGEVGGRLVVRRGDWVEEVAGVAAHVGASRVHVAADVSGFARRRLERLAGRLAGTGAELVTHDSVTVVPPDRFGRPYLVFTPYYRRWRAEPPRPPAPRPSTLSVPDVRSSPLPPGAPPPGWTGGEGAARARARAWAASLLAGYGATRDDPGGDTTSRLSAALHLGCLSAAALAAGLAVRPGGEAFVRQLCWRDFFAQLLWWRPEVAWRDVRSPATPAGARDAGAGARPAAGGTTRPDRAALAAWQEGRTGYPLVDAGMRQLLAEGWVHNRVRMVVASFLVKDLGIDWRVGAAHFMAHLVDGDLASNQLNWQWVAGTGTDANPHRVLNPTVQAARFDPDGIYARRWIPELGTDRYPAPVVDHAAAVAAWRAARLTGRSGSRPPAP